MPFHSSNPMTSLKAVMKLNKLLATGKTSGPPMPFHPPWKKARIFPMTEKAQSVEPTKQTQGSDSSESGVVINGIFFQTKEGKSTGQKSFSKQLHTHNKCQSDTSKSTDSSSDGKTLVSQESSELEREPYGQQSARKVYLGVNVESLLNTRFDRGALSIYENPYSNQNVAYMTSFDSDKEQETSDESSSESSSETEQDDSASESKKYTEQDSETETDTESETVTDTGTGSDSDVESRGENVSEREKETEGLSESRRKVTGTQEFVRSVLQSMNETQPSKPQIPSSIAEISSTVGFNFAHSMYRIAEEAMHKVKAKNKANKKESKKEDDSETKNKDPIPVMGQEKADKSQSQNSSSAGSSYIQGSTDKGNLPPIVEDEEEEMTSASLRSSLGNKFHSSASEARSPEDDKDDDTVTAD